MDLVERNTRKNVYFSKHAGKTHQTPFCNKV